MTIFEKEGCCEVQNVLHCPRVVAPDPSLYRCTYCKYLNITKKNIISVTWLVIKFGRLAVTLWVRNRRTHVFIDT